MTECNIFERTNSFIIIYLYVNFMLCSLISNIKWSKSLVCIKGHVMSCGKKRLSGTTNLTFFLAFGDDITGGQPLRNLNKHRPQLTRCSALNQHLREELKASKRESQGSIAFPIVTEQYLNNVVWNNIWLQTLILMDQVRIGIVW